MKNRKNVIPRNLDFLLVRNTETGVKYKVQREEDTGHYIGTEIGTGKRWLMFASHLRTPELYEFLSVAVKA